MTNKQYTETITCGHFLYWDMLGNLRGLKNNKETNLMWLSGDINYNYFINTSNVNDIILRMKGGEIPKNLIFLTDNFDANPTEPFRATGLFRDGLGTTGMAHQLMDTPLPKSDKRLNLFRVREISQLKAAGAILNSVFNYNLFSFDHFVDMMKTDGLFLYLAEYDGLPVGACMSQHGDDFVNISWVGTLPGYQKLSIAGYLIQEAEREGILHGKTTGVLQARSKAVGVYRRIGYREYCWAIELEMDD